MVNIASSKQKNDRNVSPVNNFNYTYILINKYANYGQFETQQWQKLTSVII